jgi:hypothetical protein
MKYRREKKKENKEFCKKLKYIHIYWDCAGLISKSKAFAYFYKMLKGQKYFIIFLKTNEKWLTSSIYLITTKTICILWQMIAEYVDI